MLHKQINVKWIYDEYSCLTNDNSVKDSTRDVQEHMDLQQCWDESSIRKYQ